MENGLNLDIDKVIGGEVANLISKMISEDTLKAKAIDMWSQLNKKNSWGESEIEKLIFSDLKDRFMTAYREIMSTDEYKAKQWEVATEMLYEINRKTRAKMIDHISDVMSGTIVNENSIYGFNNAVAQIVNNMFLNRC